jgi:hypothetical protein
MILIFSFLTLVYLFTKFMCLWAERNGSVVELVSLTFEESASGD